ncbi:type IV secretion system protein VirB10 [Paraburkholderia sp. A1RO-5L]|uniref:type IV secretion system protein VirB10 n=1 Tax=unclassified Paraburkholderia TaxID=2615204 RepID=UPI003B7D72A8
MTEPTPHEERASDIGASKVTETINGDLAMQPALDRGMPELGRLSGRPRAWWLAPLLIVAVAIAGAVWTVHGFLARHEAADKARRDALQDQPVQGRVFGDGEASASMPGSASVALATATAASAPASTQGAARSRMAPSRGVPSRSWYDAPLLATGESGGSRGSSDGSGDTAGTAGAGGVGGVGGEMAVAQATTDAAATGASSGPPGRAAAPGGPTTMQGLDSGPLAQALKSTTTPRVTAGFLGNRSLVLAQGAKIDCAGDTAFDSTNAGISTCTVTQNVYSDDGHVVLIERGSQINSEYRSNLAPGQKRVFILAARIKTPEGVTVDIGSPAADALGRMGISGYVDNHWGERLGAAMLLGMTQDAIGYLATRGANSTASVVFENTQQQGNDMASRVLERTINIAPTLTQNQGAEFTIILARDLDFSALYALEPEGPR